MSGGNTSKHSGVKGVGRSGGIQVTESHKGPALHTRYYPLSIGHWDLFAVNVLLWVCCMG